MKKASLNVLKQLVSSSFFIRGEKILCFISPITRPTSTSVGGEERRSEYVGEEGEKLCTVEESASEKGETRPDKSVGENSDRPMFATGTARAALATYRMSRFSWEHRLLAWQHLAYTTQSTGRNGRRRRRCQGWAPRARPAWIAHAMLRQPARRVKTILAATQLRQPVRLEQNT